MIMNISAIIRARRTELHMTQLALALEAGVTQETVSRIETGNLVNPQLGTVVKLLEPLGLKLEVVEK